MQRFLPACYAQAFCQGPRHVNLEENNLDRSPQLSAGLMIFPLHVGSGPGFDYGIYSVGTRAYSAYRGGRGSGARDAFKNFVEQIRQTYLAYGVDFQTPERP